MISIEDMATYCKKKGFVFANSDIYGGLSGFFDYGPLGVELKNNLKAHFWKRFVQSRSDVFGIDGTTISHPKVWEASGHATCFDDIMVEDTKTHERFRADQLIEEALGTQADGLSAEAIDKIIEENNLKSPTSGAPLSKASAFNLMFTTTIGPKGEGSLAYLRPETAQLIFTNFKNIVDTSRAKLPFGIAQMGTAYRNEISPRDFMFRVREFEQMEIEFFIHPEKEKCELLDDKSYTFTVLTEEAQFSDNKDVKLSIQDMLDKNLVSEWHAYWLKEMYGWFLDLGVNPQHIRLRQHLKDELAHYSKGCFDIEYKFPFGWKEIHGMADRGDFDLKQHEKMSKVSMAIFDEETKKKVTPTVVEPSQGVGRALLAFMFDAYHDDKKRGNIVLKLHRDLAPIQLGVFPLVNKLDSKATEIFNSLKDLFVCQYDKSGSVGRRYARADEIGIPYCVTVDFEDDGCVTIRDRDTTEQKRVKIDDLVTVLHGLLYGNKKFSEI